MTKVVYSEELKKQLEQFATQKDKVMTDSLMSIIENIAKTGVTCYPWIHLKELIFFKLQQILDLFESNYSLDSAMQLLTSPVSSSSSSPNSLLSSSISSKPTSKLVESIGGSNGSPLTAKDEELLKIKNQLTQSALTKMRNQFQTHFKEYKEPPFTTQRLCELIIDYKMYTSYSKYLCAVEKMGTVTTTLPTLSPAEVIEYNNGQTMTMRSSEPVSSPQYDKSLLSSTTTFSAATVFPTNHSIPPPPEDDDQEMKDLE